MGCCLSSRENKNNDHNSETTDSRGGAAPTSPPPVLEEESVVKEVLLETPFKLADERLTIPPETHDWKKVGVETTAVIHRDPDFDPMKKADDEIICEMSKTCSYSESLEMRRDDEEEEGVVNQRPPPARARRGTGRGRGDRRVVARRAAAPAAEKRAQVAPLRAPLRGGVVASEERGRRREAGEGSGRTSRSPVAAAETRGGPKEDVAAAEEGESLENPVVSLECFIFL